MTISKANKYFITVTSIILALLTALSPFAIDTYLSAMPRMASYFGVGLSKIELSLTIYFMGFALGNFLGGPLSDSYGRKTLALTGILLYGLTALGIPFCTKIEYVWILRALQAFGGGFASVTAMVFVKDWFEGKQVARLATIIGMIMMFAPLAAPIVGTVLLKISGWKSIFYFLAFFALILWSIFYFIMPESRDKKFITRQITKQQLIGNYKVFFSNKKAILVLLSISFSVSGMFVFITSASYIYIEYFGIEEHIFPFLFGANIILNVILSFFNTILLKRFDPEKMLWLGLIIQLIAGFGLLASVLFSGVYFWGVFLSIVLFVGSLGFVFGNGTAVILNMLPQISGSANATIGVTRFIISFIVASLPALFHVNNLIPIALAMFGCTLIANFLFFYFKKHSLKYILN